MSSGQIEVVIDENGGTTVKVLGVAGAGCKAITADLEAALGKVSGSKKTRDYSRSESKVRGSQGA